jgi:hypothetical protein
MLAEVFFSGTLVALRKGVIDRFEWTQPASVLEAIVASTHEKEAAYDGVLPEQRVWAGR